MANDISTFTHLEDDYTKCVSFEHRKKYAQIFTPPQIAELMSRWLLGNPNLKTVLEPAFGLGIFSRMLLSQRKGIQIKGFDVDPLIFKQAQKAFKTCDAITLKLEDYIYNDWDNKYDGIICNPPYFKFHDYDNKTTIKEIETRLSCNLSGLTNFYALFLLKSLHQLNERGRCAYLIPSEFLNSDYGKLIKSYLVKDRTLRHIVVIDFEQMLFDNALTTASLLLFAKDENIDGIEFTTVHNLDDLTATENLIQEYPRESRTLNSIGFGQIKPEEKWSTYYRQQNRIRYKQLVTFSTYGKAVRGIATGANDFFTFNLSKAKRFAIEKEYLLATICKSSDVKSPIFTQNHLKKLQDEDRPVFLLNVGKFPDTKVKKYLSIGEEKSIHTKYLTASRNPWYSLEKRPPAPIWVSVFNRNGVRFVRNEAGVSNLTTFHCIYLNPIFLPKIDLFMAYLLTDVSREIFEDNRREYGGGLQKFEPNDINNSKVLDILQLDEGTERQILSLYGKYKESILADASAKHYLAEIDGLFKEKFAI